VLQILRDRQGRQAEQGYDPQILGGVYKVVEERAHEDEAERAQAQATRTPKSTVTTARAGTRIASEGARASGFRLHLGVHLYHAQFLPEE